MLVLPKTMTTMNKTIREDDTDDVKTWYTGATYASAVISAPAMASVKRRCEWSADALCRVLALPTLMRMMVVPLLI